MRFQRLHLGGRELLFGSSNSTRLPFSFPTPIRGAYALLEGCYFRKDEGDVEVREFRVSLLTLFDPLQSATDGMVQVDFSLPGSEGGAGLATSLVSAEIGILVIAV